MANLPSSGLHCPDTDYRPGPTHAGARRFVTGRRAGLIGLLAASVIAVPAAHAAQEDASGDPAAQLGAVDNVSAASIARVPAAKVADPAAVQLATRTGTELTTDAAAPTDAAITVAPEYVHPVDAEITSDFGYRTHPVLGHRKLHAGTDFGADCGTPVGAVAGGQVTDVSRSAASGKRVEVDHGVDDQGRQVTTKYYHLSTQSVAVGDVVSQGQTIGQVGNTGRSTGCHLHLGAELDGTEVDPMGLVG